MWFDLTRASNDESKHNNKVLNNYQEHEEVQDFPADSIDLELLGHSFLRLNENILEASLRKEKEDCVSHHIHLPKNLKAVKPLPDADRDFRSESSADQLVVHLDFDLHMVGNHRE